MALRQVSAQRLKAPGPGHVLMGWVPEQERWQVPGQALCRVQELVPGEWQMPAEVACQLVRAQVPGGAPRQAGQRVLLT